jgi:hypothetical protein
MSHAAIVEISLEELHQRLGLPYGAVIVGVDLPIHRDGIVELKIEGRGCPRLIAGGFLERIKLAELQ